MDKIQTLINSKVNTYIPYHDFYYADKRFMFCKLTSIDSLDNYEINMAYNMHKINKETKDFLNTADKREQFFHDSRLLSIASNWSVLTSENIVEEFFKYPYTIYIGLENKCDTKCPQCLWFGEPSQLHKTNYFRQHNRITDEKFYKIVEFAKLGNSRIVFSGPGEPLYDDRIFEFIKYAKSQKIRKVEVAYHPNMLNEENFIKLLKLDVNPPFYIHLFLISSNLNIAKDKERIKYILRIAKNHNLSNECIVFHITYSPTMFNEAFRYFLEIKEIGYEAQLYNESYTAKHTINNNRYSCGLIFKEMYIFPDGSVGNCSIQRNILGFEDESIFSYGNIYKDSLHDIWFGEKHRKIAMEHINHNIDKDSVCANCNSWYNEC
ncbi:MULTISPECIES: radical SAM/SPASM domain-containing protein [Helicobacter]|nr:MULTISPECIES: radical SAM/SPASM domain-containing protein [Helicobacter]MDA3967992.1 SPASM domain-containing protein [Helicobacter sp. WB40]